MLFLNSDDGINMYEYIYDRHRNEMCHLCMGDHASPLPIG